MQTGYIAIVLQANKLNLAAASEASLPMQARAALTGLLFTSESTNNKKRAVSKIRDRPLFYWGNAVLYVDRINISNAIEENLGQLHGANFTELSINIDMQQKIRIALIEDDEGLNEAVALLLQSAGYEVKAYQDITTFNKANDPPPDLYVIDRYLGQEDGLDLCRALKADPVTTHRPVVIISANDEVEAMCAAAGANAFLAKPFTKRQLTAVLQQVFEAGTGF